MRIHWSAACLLIGVMAGALGCGSYSAPSSPMSSPDSSSSDSMPRPGY